VSHRRDKPGRVGESLRGFYRTAYLGLRAGPVKGHQPVKASAAAHGVCGVATYKKGSANVAEPFLDYG
jgi:putative methionine-R-sulfoxide reductase with GAF domain